MSQERDVPELDPIPKLAMWQAEEASTIMCCPVLKPQMTGEPLLPGALREKVSVVQSPMAPTKKSKCYIQYQYPHFVVFVWYHWC